MAAPQKSLIDHEKKALRRLMVERRRREGSLCEADLRAALLREILKHPAQRVAAVWPLGDEIDLRPLCHDLVAEGRAVLLPETTPKGSPLLFRLWQPEGAMIAGRFGTHHPAGDIAVPDLVLVPLLAFDRNGFRLGYGGGYYDRTLAALNVSAIGYGLSWQEVPSIPSGRYDVPLPLIVTEQGTIVTESPLRKNDC